MEKTKNELHLLIQSLSSTEKAYFKKFAYKRKNEKDNDYFLVFDILTKQETFSETDLKRKLKNSSIIDRLPQAKKYLFDLIINTFTTNQTGDSLAASFDIEINQIRFLIDRKIINTASKRLSKLKDNILKYEALEFYTQYFQLYNSILSYNKDDEQERVNLNNEYKKVLEQLENIRIYEHLKNLSFDLKRNKEILYIRKEENKQIKNFVLEKDWLSKEEAAITIRSKLLFYFIRNQVWLMSSDVEKAYKETLIQYELLKQNKDYATYNLKDFVKVMANLIRRMQNTNQFEMFDEVKTTLQKTLSKINDDTFVRVKRFELMYVDRNLNIDLFHFDEIKNILPEFIFVYNNYFKDRRDTLLTICNDIVLTYIYLDDFENALTYINLLLNDKYLKHSKDLESYGFIIRQIILIELKQSIFNENEYYNIKKKLYRDNKLYQIENKVLDMLEEYSLVETSKEKAKVIANYQAEILEMLKNPLQKNFLKYFQIDWWMTAKLHNKTIYQYFNKKKQ
ncbi:MAG: hypothetical protein R2801_10285 [Chitinophagales bacterium]